MRIDARVLMEKVQFERDTGKEPTNLYLGREEMVQLLMFAEKNAPFKINEDRLEDGDRLEFNGLFCFVVDADRHLACA